MSEKLKIPKGWEIVPLGRVCRLKNGYAFKSSEYQDKGVPIIRISDINGRIVSTSKSVRITENEDFEDSLIRNGDILIAMSGATTGKFGIFKSTELAYQNQRVGNFQILRNDILDNNFLFFLVHSLKKNIEQGAYGGAQPNISSGKIEALKIPLPPLAEQHRIVEKIEALFSELDNGVEQLKTAQQQLKVYRQAVLKWAFEGKLTNDNIKDGELPEEWIWLRMKDVCSKIQDGTHFSPSVQYREPAKGRYMYITSKNIREFQLKLDNISYIDEDVHQDIYARCNPEKGDVLLTKDGINTGMVAVNTIDEPFSLLSSVALLKPDKNKLLGKYLCYFIGSPIGEKFINKSMTGTAIKRIILEKTRLCEIPLTSLEEQHQIVQEIETRLSVCDKIEETISASLQQAEALRQSILKKAFEGKLVPQNPNDEPASVLLERIRGEQIKQDGKKEKGRTSHV